MQQQLMSIHKLNSNLCLGVVLAVKSLLQNKPNSSTSIKNNLLKSDFTEIIVNLPSWDYVYHLEKTLVDIVSRSVKPVYILVVKIASKLNPLSKCFCKLIEEISTLRYM